MPDGDAPPVSSDEHSTEWLLGGPRLIGAVIWTTFVALVFGVTLYNTAPTQDFEYIMVGFIGGSVFVAALLPVVWEVRTRAF